MKIEIPLTDKQSELDSSLNQFDVTGYGGAKGGGKSHGLRSVILLRTLTRPKHVGALFRRTYPELEENHIGPLFKQFPGLRDHYNSSRREIRIPALESEFKFRYCESLSDVDRQAGREYHTVGIEEAGDWNPEMIFRLLRNCNRSTVSGIKAAAALTFNWGGISHGLLKRIFITKELRDYEQKLTYNFILAKVEDNPAILEHDPGYLSRLESEPNEALRRAYRHGDADIIAGQFFDLNRDVHVIKPFPIPAHWNWFGAYDYGFNHPAVWLFFAVDGDGRVYLVHEIVKAQMGIDEQALAVRDAAGSHGLVVRDLLFQSGHDCWAKKKGKDPTIAEDFLEHGITLVRAKIDRVLGAHRVRQYLAHRKDHPPALQIFSTCRYTIDCLARMVHDPNRPEDVLKVDAVNGDPMTGDDPYDAIRMGLMSRPSLNPPALPPPEPNSDEWRKEQEREMERQAEEQYARQQTEMGYEDLLNAYPQ